MATSPEQVVMANSYEHPFAAICATWLAKIELAKASKYDLFGKWADEAMQFFDGAHDWMWDSQYASGKGGFLAKSTKAWMPKFRMTYNRMFEAVALIGPALYFQNPNVLAEPQPMPQYDPADFGIPLDNPEDPAVMQLQQMLAAEQAEMSARNMLAKISGRLLNWMQQNVSKRESMRFVMTDALIKGAGYSWTGVSSFESSGRKYISSEYVNADDVFKDPDARYDRDVQWVTRRCRMPLNQIEERFQLTPGSLKGHIQSFNSEASDKARGRGRSGGEKAHTDGKSYDIGEFYEIYSRNGFGQLLVGSSPTNMNPPGSPIDTSAFGKYCFLAVMKGVPYPLNLPSDRVAQWRKMSDEYQRNAQAGQIMPDENGEMPPDEGFQEMFMRAQWPFPAWQDRPTGNGWPFTEYCFYRKPGSVWPLSIFKPVAGEMRFINWCMSFLADKVAQSCQTIVGVMKAAAAEIKTQLAGDDSPFAIIELSDIVGKSVSDVISFLQSPNFDSEIWTVIAAVDEKIDKRLALTDLAYGLSAQQMRSAKEAEVRDSRISVRPDDMANSFEDCLSKDVLKQLEAAYYFLEGQDVQPVVGGIGAGFWDQHRAANNPDSVVHALQVRIEAGSTRKPNRQNKIAALREFGNVASGVMQAFAQMGVPDPWNAYCSDMAEALEVDGSRYLVQPPPPPEASGPTPEQQAEQERLAAESQKLQMELFGKQQQLVFDQQSHEQEMEQSDEEHAQKMRQEAQMARARAKAATASKRKAGK